MTYEFISEKEPCCGLAQLADHQQQGRDYTRVGSSRGSYRDSGADLDGQSPSHTCVPVEPSADPHGVPTHCDGAADRRGGVGQGPAAAILSYDFISYRHRWYWSRRKTTTVMAQSYEFIIHADLRLRPAILCAEL